MTTEFAIKCKHITCQINESHNTTVQKSKSENENNSCPNKSNTYYITFNAVQELHLTYFKLIWKKQTTEFTVIALVSSHVNWTNTFVHNLRILNHQWIAIRDNEIIHYTVTPQESVHISYKAQMGNIYRFGDLTFTNSSAITSI